MKIPKQAKKVFSGVIFDVYHWQQKMYDGTMATFEMLKRPGAVRVIAVQNNKIILNEEKQPTCKRTLGTFGGRIDAGETPIACAKRELLEESGLISNDWERLDSYEFYYEKMDFTIYLYVARDCKKIKSIKKDRGEKTKAVPVTFGQFIKIVTDKNSSLSKEFILNILRMKAERKLNQFKNKLFKK